jgi:hypothetical protein
MKDFATTPIRSATTRAAEAGMVFVSDVAIPAPVHPQRAVRRDETASTILSRL